MRKGFRHRYELWGAGQQIYIEASAIDLSGWKVGL